MTRRPVVAREFMTGVRLASRALVAAGSMTTAGVSCGAGGCGHSQFHATDGGPSRCPSARAGCKYFKAVCYEGYREGQGPGRAEPTCEQVASDLESIARYTRGIRTYGSRSTMHEGLCIPALTDRLGLDLYLGVWIEPSQTDEQNIAAIDDAVAIASHGHPSIKALIVGNEFLYRGRQISAQSPPRQGGRPPAVEAESRLVRYLAYARGKAPPTVAVVTTELCEDWLTASRALFDAVDFVVWNLHPWWAGVPVSQAATLVQTSRDRLAASMARIGVAKRQVLGETGWPWAYTHGAAVGSEANQALYFRDLSQLSSSIGLEYWVFEAFDQAWKGDEGAVGGSWGLWPADRHQPARVIISGLPLPPTSASLIAPADMWP